MQKSEFTDPFEKIRLEKGHQEIDDQDDPVSMILRHADVRKCAIDWETFQSGAEPGRIVVPSEVKIRDIRQIPFEVDPPMHSKYRNLIEDWFRRPFQADYEAELNVQIGQLIDATLEKSRVEIVSEFSLVLQSNALTILLNIPKIEADVWIGWGTHVFRSEDNPLDGEKANILYDYIDQQIELAIKNPGKDLYSLLLASEIDGRKMTKEEVKGVMILTFAGGRDTVINAVTNTIAYLAEHPKTLERIRQEPKIIHRATEELMRYFSPLTHMGRVVTKDTSVCEHAIKKDSRISLCWASANRDETVFENPNEVNLDRKKNPHIAFGLGTHNCLGAHHARQVIKVLLKILAAKIQSIDILESEENMETWGPFNRKVGFEKLLVKFNKKN